jgi:hypothetical protein
MAWTDRVKLSMLKFYHTVGCTYGLDRRVKLSTLKFYHTVGCTLIWLGQTGKAKYAKVLSYCGMYTHMAWTDRVKLSTLKFYHTVGGTLIWLGQTG